MAGVPRSAVSAAFVVGLALAGCHRLLPFSTVETDAAGTDVAVADGPADARPTDGAPLPDIDAAISPLPKVAAGDVRRHGLLQELRAPRDQA